MSRPVILTKALAAASTNNIALSQTPVSGTAFTLNGSAVSGGVATLDTARRVIITAGSEAAPRTVLLTGTNGSGTPITETVTIPATSAGAYATLQDFATVSAALPGGGGWTAAATIGTNSVGSTPWQLLNNHITPFEVSYQLTLTGTATFEIELTDDSPMMTVPWGITGSGGSPSVPVPTPYNLGTLSTSTNVALSQVAVAWRLTILSGAGSVQIRAVQAGLRN
jgi:hypothetical protein